MATEGAVEGTDTRADCAVDSDARLLLGASVMNPWKFRSEVRQQSGNEEELGGGEVASLGQHACVWPGYGTQSALSPESCTRKSASRMYTPLRTSKSSLVILRNQGAITQSQNIQGQNANAIPPEITSLQYLDREETERCHVLLCSSDTIRDSD